MSSVQLIHRCSLDLGAVDLAERPLQSIASMPALSIQNESAMNPTAYGPEREPEKFSFPCHPYLGRLA